jgi:hypothetical protein
MMVVSKDKGNHCGCGCGGLTNNSNKFINGHTNKGRHFSEGHRRNLSLTHMGNYHSEESKQRIRFANLGEKNNSWKGDDVGYWGLHKWINRNRPKPPSGNARFVIIDRYAMLRMLLGYMTEISRIGNMSAAHVM